MDKKTFLNIVNYEDKILLSNLYDKIMLGEKIHSPVFTNEFYTPNLWKTITRLGNEFTVNIYTYGIFEECERKTIAFSKESIYEYPVKLIKITNKSKFERLQHRDYLGAIMALGIKREKFGDLILDGDICYGAVCADVTQFVLYNLNYIGRCPCEVKILENPGAEEIKPKYETLSIISTSLRLDSIVSSLCSISRSKAVELINSGKVLVDYIETYEKDKMADFQSTITIRGYGKFKIIEEVGFTQKSRLRLSVRKYV